MGDLKVPYSGNFISAYFDRLESGSQSTIYLSFILLLFIGWLLINILGIAANFFSFLKKPLARLFSCCCSSKLKEVKSKDFFKEMDVLSLEAMLTKAEEDLDDFNKCANELVSHGVNLSFKENRFEEETDIDSESVQ